jgi:hypothetical protein
MDGWMDEWMDGWINGWIDMGNRNKQSGKQVSK